VVSIAVEGRHLTELRAEPGQFFRWRFLSPDTWRTAHPFSLSATDRRPLSAAAMLRAVPDLPERDVYMCAAPGMSEAVRMSLREAGPPAAYLHEERFAW
jgi:ferredoxin-NADP reductase